MHSSSPSVPVGRGGLLRSKTLLRVRGQIADRPLGGPAHLCVAFPVHGSHISGFSDERACSQGFHTLCRFSYDQSFWDEHGGSPD
jgi:hypothetical protein